jgi:hypothetical protein
MRGTLLDVIATLDALPADDPCDVEPTIFARRPWTVHAEAVVLNEDAVSSVAASAPDFAYLLEVDLAKDVIRAWSEWRDGAAAALGASQDPRPATRMHDSLAELVATCDRPRADRRCALLDAIDHEISGHASAASR